MIKNGCFWIFFDVLNLAYDDGLCGVRCDATGVKSPIGARHLRWK